ncbi:MAG: receptor ligand binding region family protein [Ramlibacter sp.]|jgi:branched-chain amino acid transport system substrate-binding protein|nr:receptor ligand binding region family protein [Ramlibacter sp.]
MLDHFRTSLLLGLGLFAGAAAIAADSPLQSAQQPVRIGIIFPLTGGSSDMGNSARVGAQVAVDEINQVGGYLGRKFELVIRDDKADNDTGLKMAEDLVLKEKVQATIGFCNSGVAMKALDVFQNNKSILIVPCATGTSITSKYPAKDSFIFRTSARDALQSQFLVDDIVRRGLKKVALLVDTSGYGDGGLKDLEAAISKAGLPAPTVMRFKVGVKSLTDELTELKKSGAQALIGWTVGPEEGVIAAARAAVKWNVPYFAPWGLSHASAFASSGGAVEGGFMVQTVLPNIYMERNRAFLAAYGKLSKELPIGSLMSAAQTYDSVHLLLRAIFESKGDLSGPGLKKALENLPRPYPGVITTYDKPFNIQDHDVITANMLWMGTWRNGEREYAFKEDAQRATIIRRKL